MEVPRPFLTVHVFGSVKCGKTTLKKQWFESSHSRVLSEFADVHIRIQQECSNVLLNSIQSSIPAGYRHNSFIVIYRPDSQESIQLAQSSVELIHKAYSMEPLPLITVVENHFEDTFKPHTEQPTDFPRAVADTIGLIQNRVTPKLWRVKVNDSVFMGAVFDSIIVNPILSTLNDQERSKLIEAACLDGHLQVVKLLISTMKESNLVSWLLRSMSTMDPIVRQSSSKLTALTEVAKFAYRLDMTMAMSTIVRMAEKYPNASLYLLNQFGHQSQKQEHFVVTGVALGLLPKSWFENKQITHINVSNNLLLSLPVELFQEPTLCSLNLSHNCLEKLPSILKWNCPKLREIDVSHNRLIDEPFSIFEGKKDRTFTVDKNLPKKTEQRNLITAAQRTLRLTGYNLYPCICSLTRVNISNNPTLSQIPEWVCVVPNLTLLEMKALPRVTTLTPYLAHARSLCILQLDTEQLVSPPPTEAQRGTHVIMAYLRCRLRGSSPYRHVRLVLVGVPESGKTTLFKQFLKGGSKFESDGRMRETAFDYPPKLKSRRDQPRVTFHVVDFAGNEILRSVHKCFMTFRTVYLCLWNITDGKDSLKRALPWLRTIQACAPDSPVVLVATHIDRRPGISGNTILQWEEELFGEISQLCRSSHTSKLGLPPIMQSVVMDCRNKDDVDLLVGDIYRIALAMKLRYAREPMLEELLPRAYQELQSLIEVKVRSLRREGYSAPVLRHEEFVSYVRSLTLHNPNDIEQDDEEFALAVHFLHEAGVIVHYKSTTPGVSDLYCLDPQWLFDTIASVIQSVTRRHSQYVQPTISSEDLPNIFRRSRVPGHLYSSFLALMESFDIIVSLDFEKKVYLFPTLLPQTPSPYYPEYNLTLDDPSRVCQYINLDYVPPALFPQLLSRVLLYIRQLSGQLLSVAAGNLREDGDSQSIGSLSSHTLPESAQSTLRLSHAYHVDHHGYMTQDDSVNNESTLRSQIWALSATNVAGTPRPTPRHRSLTEKLVTLSEPLLQNITRSPSLLSFVDTESFLSHSDHFSNYTFWQNGLYTEFPCGTRFWLELCERAISIVIQGELIPRVKTLSFLTSCIGALVEESYAGLHYVSYSPCPSCLKDFWKNFQSVNSFAASMLEVSQTIQLNEFSEKAEYSRRPSVTTGQSQSFGGSDFSISMSPPPPNSPEDDLPFIAVLENQLALFPLETTVQQSVLASTILCPKCQQRISLQALSPHVLLVDFKDNFLLNPKKLVFEESASSKLGGGGFGKVFKGTYNGEDVAVKVFRKQYNNQVLLHRYKDLREELTIMSQLDHPRVVSLLGVALRPLCIVLRLAPQGSLKDHLALCPQGIQSNVAHRLLFQIADGIRYLHSVYVVHRDIKPGNVLIWSLDPERVDAKLADYGVSQFYTPGGLRRHKGTEEYMAPELFRSHSSQTYDEKVDIFSFALILHSVVTGQKLFAGVANKREQLHRLSNLHIPQLSAALAEAMTENSPPSTTSKFKHLLKDGRHPAARTDIINSCHSVCMQQLMVNCLAINPQDRPSARGVCSHLLVCPGGMPQANFYITNPVIYAGYSAQTNTVVAMQKDSCRVMIIPTDSWQVERINTPYTEEQVSCMTVVGKEVFFASSVSGLVFSLELPELQSGHISAQPLVGEALCMFPQKSPKGEGFQLVVGMSGGRVAVFKAPPQSSERARHILESQPLLTQVMTNPDPLKTAINCGTHHKGCVWCGCGRYLIGLDPKEYLMKVYKPITRDESTRVTMVIGCHDYLWVGLEERSQIVICDAVKAQGQETLDIHAILGRSGVPASKALVTDIVRGHNVVWVSTNGGHLLAFNPLTADVVLVHRREQHITRIICLYGKQVVTFAKGSISMNTDDEDDICGLFTVWTDYIDADIG